MKTINYCNGYRLWYYWNDEYIENHNGDSGTGIYYNSRIKMWLAVLKYLFNKDIKEIKLEYN